MLARVGRSDLQHSLHASSPNCRTRRTPHLPPQLFTHWTMIGRSLAHLERNQPTGTPGGSATCFVARFFYGRMPFLPPTHQMMSAVVGLPYPVLCHSQDDHMKNYMRIGPYAYFIFLENYLNVVYFIKFSNILIGQIHRIFRNARYA